MMKEFEAVGNLEKHLKSLPAEEAEHIFNWLDEPEALAVMKEAVREAVQRGK